MQWEQEGVSPGMLGQGHQAQEQVTERMFFRAYEARERQRYFIIRESSQRQRMIAGGRVLIDPAPCLKTEVEPILGRFHAARRIAVYLRGVQETACERCHSEQVVNSKREAAGRLKEPLASDSRR